MNRKNSQNTLSTRSIAPAQGERRAIGGLYPQYLVSASLIYQGLRDGGLQWIRVADPEAGRVDDLQIGSQSRVDAYQMKWSQYSGNFTFKNLITPFDTAPCLIAQLADGWKALQASYGCRVVVHLLTNDNPTKFTSAPVGDSPPTPPHFAAFIEQAWKPCHQGQQTLDWDVSRGWGPAWEDLRKTSGLSKQEFQVFVLDCKLDFGYSLPDLNNLTTKENEIIAHDLEHLAFTLFGTVYDPARIIELNRAQLLARLGWTERFTLRSTHEFPEPRIPYFPVENTVCRLEESLSNLPGGYLAVLGTAGSGKSTLLTQTLRYRPERVIRYYAYVPEARDPVNLRGESENFLHDVVLMLEQAGFRVGKSLSQFDHAQLLNRFYEQIQRLHQDWETTGRKTIILIDGLDHITREQNPNRSLLHDLPLPEQIPDGVYIILGSQTDQCFPDRVQASVQRPERRIQMEPLKRKAVYQIIEQTRFSVLLTPEQKEDIYVLSEGHPLALEYLLNRLRNTSETQDIDSVLHNTERYEGNIEAQYHSYWKQIEANDELVLLFGLLARLRGEIDLSWIKTWADRAVVDRLQRKFWHYFRIEDQERWYFLHNSFRLFLLQRTAESLPGVFDPSQDRVYYHELAKRCAHTSIDSHWAWEELYYRFLAEEHETILERASQEWFRNQFFAFRPLDAIQNDIKLAIRSCGVFQNLIALIRLILAGAEMALRQFHLKNTSLVPILINLGYKQIAIDHVRDGNRLRIDTTAALHASLDLQATGLVEEARRVFELAEPLELLAATKPIEDDPQDETVTLLETWAKTAIHFRDLNKILETVSKLYRETDRFRRMDAETATRALRNRLVFYVGLALLDARRLEELTKLGTFFDINHHDDQRCWFWLHVHTWKDCLASEDQSGAQYFLENILRQVNTLELGSEERTVLAEGIYRILGDKEQTRIWLQDVPQPELQINIFSSDINFNLFLQRFRLNRLLHTLGDCRFPTEIIPDSSDTDYQGAVYFERSLCVIARIWAEAWRGNTIDSSTLQSEIFPLLRFFHTPWKEYREVHFSRSRSRILRHIAQGVADEFYKLLINAVAQHGTEAIDLLRSNFEKEWTQPETGSYWPIDVCRQVVLALWHVGVERQWAIRILRKLEDRMFENLSIYSRIEECRKQAEAWLTVGENEFARQSLKQIFQASFGVGFRKDFQLDTWIRWLSRINEAEPQKAAERITWFIQAFMTLKETTESDDAVRYAAEEMLATVFQWSPRKAVLLFQWFLQHRVIWHEDGIPALLRAALESSTPPISSISLFLKDFLLPLSTGADTRLVALLIEQCANCHGTEQALETARSIALYVKLYALPSLRTMWNQGIAQAGLTLGLDMQSIGLEVKDFRFAPKEEYSSRQLILQDVSWLSLEEVKLRVSSLSELEELLNQELQGEFERSYFDWEPIIERLAQNFDSHDVETVANLLRTPKVLATLSKRLCALGDFKGAWSLAEQALAVSNVYGWNSESDEGARLAACNALLHADPIQARPRICEMFIRDLTGEFWYPQNIALNFEKIIPLLTDDMPVSEIWATIENYVYALFEGCPLPEINLPDFNKEPEQDTSSRAIADLLVFYLEHPVTIMAQAAQRICAKLLLQYDPVIQDVFHELLEKSDNVQEPVLMVLDAVSLQDPKAIVRFKNEIVGLAQSPNYAVRQITHTICKRIGHELPQPSYISISLAATYQFVLPSHDSMDQVGERGILFEEPLPDTDDPIEIVCPYDGQLGIIAKAAKIPKLNVCQRAVQIMCQLSPRETWLAQGELDLRDELESTGVRLQFRRPRAVLARRAMFYVVAELMDAGVITPEIFQQVEELFYFYDPVMLLTEPQERPSYIHPLGGIGWEDANYEEWVEQIENANFPANFQMGDGFIVLAEETTLKSLEWKTPTEIRRSVVFASNGVHSNSKNVKESFFYKMVNCQIRDYFHLQVHPSLIPLIFQHTPLVYDTPGHNWLALNPTVGFHLAWKLADDGLFRWINDKGQIMVESLWWTDGFLGQRVTHSDEVGEGWLVVASEEAWNAIKSQFGNLKRISYLERSVSQNGGQRLRRDMSLEQDI